MAIGLTDAVEPLGTFSIADAKHVKGAPQILTNEAALTNTAAFPPTGVPECLRQVGLEAHALSEDTWWVLAGSIGAWTWSAKPSGGGNIKPFATVSAMAADTSLEAGQMCRTADYGLVFNVVTGTATPVTNVIVNSAVSGLQCIQQSGPKKYVVPGAAAYAGASGSHNLWTLTIPEATDVRIEAELHGYCASAERCDVTLAGIWSRRGDNNASEETSIQGAPWVLTDAAWAPDLHQSGNTISLRAVADSLYLTSYSWVITVTSSDTSGLNPYVDLLDWPWQAIYLPPATPGADPATATHRESAPGVADRWWDQSGNEYHGVGTGFPLVATDGDPYFDFVTNAAKFVMPFNYLSGVSQATILLVVTASSSLNEYYLSADSTLNAVRWYATPRLDVAWSGAGQEQVAAGVAAGLRVIVLEFDGTQGDAARCKTWTDGVLRADTEISGPATLHAMTALTVGSSGGAMPSERIILLALADSLIDPAEIVTGGALDNAIKSRLSGY
jgi:hypothetical protein